MWQIIVMHFYNKWEYFYSFSYSINYLLFPPTCCSTPVGPQGAPHSTLKTTGLEDLQTWAHKIQYVLMLTNDLLEIADVQKKLIWSSLVMLNVVTLCFWWTSSLPYVSLPLLSRVKLSPFISSLECRDPGELRQHVELCYSGQHCCHAVMPPDRMLSILQ